MLRRAEQRDAGRLFAWRNESDTRRWSRNGTPVRWADHVRWLRDSAERADRRLHVAVLHRPVGTVRFDAVSSDTWEVSVTVAPEARGRGLGGALMDEALPSIAREGARTILAEVRSDNAASRNLFLRAGFRLEQQRDQWQMWMLSF
nr:GNAT family N-acetyltransferase [Microbacterium sp. CFH 90308]